MSSNKGKKSKPHNNNKISEAKSNVLTPEIIDSPREAKDLIKKGKSVHKTGSSKKKSKPPTTSRALAATDPVAAYISEITRYKVLTREEEQEVAIHYQETGDPKSAEKLVTANLRFVVKIAAEYSRFGAKMIDLIQEGNIGLMHAVREFNPYKNVKLISYAVWWIRGYIQDFLMKQYSLVKIGTSQKQRKLFYQLQKHKDEMDRLGPSQVIAQLSGSLEIDEKDIINMSQRVLGRDVSLSQPLNDNDKGTLLDLQTSPLDISTDVQLEQFELLKNLHHKVEELKPQLNERELFLLEKRILSDTPLTLQEIGQMNQVSREAVRQMEARVIAKIKKMFLESVGLD